MAWFRPQLAQLIQAKIHNTTSVRDKRTEKDG
jgi:hypothetical protein